MDTERPKAWRRAAGSFVLASAVLALHGACDATSGGPALSTVDATERPELGPSGGCEVDRECAHLSTGACEQAICESATGDCVVAPRADGSPCDDGDACTTEDTCADGACVAGPDRTCQAPDACQQASCDPELGCVTGPAADGAPCSDGNPCTDGDACLEGICNPGEVVCECKRDRDCAPFDTDKCDAPLVCVDEQCVPGVDLPPVTCDQPEDPCLAATCDPQTGACTTAPVADGTACGSGDGCAAEASCQDGACVPPEGVCDDDNPCTEDACDPVEGCQHAPIDGPCDDGDPCTGGGQCVDGGCVADTLECQCLTDADCKGDDFDACVGEWTCEEGQCQLQPGTGVDCDHLEVGPCETPACDPTIGACSAVRVGDGEPCEDGDPCSTGTTCSDGVCGGGDPTVCDDGNACTDDACVPGEGCLYTPNEAPCDDGNACTEGDHCLDGACAGGSAVLCEDEPCHTATCDPEQGCVLSPGEEGDPCDDGDPCTEDDACGEGGVCGGDPVDCDDGDPCTVDSCGPTGSCQQEPVVCVGATGPCEVDACDAETGDCVVEPAPPETPCDDGDPCTEDDACGDEGACAGGPIDCDDGDPCTIDACEGGACVHEEDPDCEPGPCHGVAPGGPCDDGDGDTVADLCIDGVCRGFTRGIQSGGPTSGSLLIRHVDFAFDRWIVALEVKASPLGSGGILATWTDTDGAAVYSGTAQSDYYTQLHAGYAADDGGGMWVFRPDTSGGPWLDSTGLADALEDADADAVGTLWADGEPLPDSKGTLWVAGHKASGSPWVWRCTVAVEEDVDGTCYVEATGALDRVEFMALAAEPCPAEDTSCSGTRLVLGADLSSTPAGGYYNDVFERHAGGGWSTALGDYTGSPSRTRDAVALGGGRFLIVGTAGYVRHRSADGTWSEALLFADDQGQWRLEGAWVEADTVLVVGWIPQSAGQRALRLWTLPVDADPASGSSWTAFDLGTVSGSEAGLFDVHGDGAGTLRAVGSRRRPVSAYHDGLVYTRAAP